VSQFLAPAQDQREDCRSVAEDNELDLYRSHALRSYLEAI
jgi:hypothetical protein